MLRGEPIVTLNCDMMAGELYRAIYPGTVTRGYHYPPIQQPYFNTVALTGAVPDGVLIEMIDHAYDVVVGKLPKKFQKELRGASDETGEGLRLEIGFTNRDYLIGWLLGFGGGVKVLEPSAIADDIEAAAEKILSRYKET